MKKITFAALILISLASCSTEKETSRNVKFRANRAYSTFAGFKPFKETLILDVDSAYKPGDILERNGNHFILSERSK